MGPGFFRIWSGLSCLFSFFWLPEIGSAQDVPANYAVQVRATLQDAPPQITLDWVPVADATSYSIYRRSGPEEGWALTGVVSGGSNSFTDTAVAMGTGYEYQLIRGTSAGYLGHGYLYGGIRLPLVEDRGGVVLLVDDTFSGSLTNELARLQSDLVGDGWRVYRHDVARTASAASVRKLIRGSFWTYPGVRSVFLFGHIPVPYAGDIAPDIHINHRGAWPTDVYYADMDGPWTDSYVNDAVAERPENRNRPGDGKFDQSEPPGNQLLEVGRVDLSNLMNFANKPVPRYEVDLLRQYLEKDHNFRHRVFTLQRRGILCDNFGVDSGVAYSASGFMNFAPLVGANNVRVVGRDQYFPTVRNEDYLWTYACGGGSYTACAGVGVADDFAVNDIRTVFTMFFGSYYGDWDNESNFLRSVLGSSSYTLTAACAGLPHWYFHHMALGETVGFSTKTTQKNSGAYGPNTIGRHEVHIGLMGDPTLRMHPVIPVSNLNASPVGGGVTLSWNPSGDDSILAHAIYRSDSMQSSFTRVGMTAAGANSFTEAPSPGAYIYMVRAIKLESSPSGSYTNASQGVFVNATVAAPPPAAPSQLQGLAVSTGAIRLAWSDNANNEDGFSIERKTGGSGTYAHVADVPANTTNYLDAALLAGTEYFYRVQALNSIGASPYSNEAMLTTLAAGSQPGLVNFVKTDEYTAGNWNSFYGAEGFAAAGAFTQFPPYVQTLAQEPAVRIWAGQTLDGRALPTPAGSNRVASAWFSATATEMDFNITDGRSHRLAVYLVDWDNQGRSERLELLDPVSGTVFATRAVSNFVSGVWIVWEVSGRFMIRAVPLGVTDAVISAVFFDPPGFSPLRIESETTTGIAQPLCRLKIFGEPGLQFVLEASPDLMAWQPISTNTFPGATLKTTNSSTLQRRFYRARRFP